MYFDYIRSVLNFLDPCPPNIFFFILILHMRENRSRAFWVWLSSLNMILSYSIYFFFYKLQHSTLSYGWITYDSLHHMFCLPEQNCHVVLLFRSWEPRSAHRRVRHTHVHCAAAQNRQVAETGRGLPLSRRAKSAFPQLFLHLRQPLNNLWAEPTYL